MTGPVTTGDLGDGESDPSSASCDIAFPVAVNEYITDELGFQTDRPYVVQSDEVNKKWKFGLDNQSISQENTIYEAMSKNPFLKVWVLCGYYDAATPFYAAEWVYDHVFINDRLQDNLSFAASGRRGLVRQRIMQENHAKRRRLPERQSPPLCICEKTDVRELSVQTAKQTDDSPLCCGFEPAAQVVQFPQECFLRSG